VKPSVGWLAALIPALIGLGLALVLNSGWLENPMLYMRGALSAFCVLIGVGLSLGLFIGVGLHQWRQGLAAQALARDLAQQAAQERRRFLQRLDHELKNPLTAIRAGLANVTEAADVAQQRAAVQSVEAQVRRVSRLTADLRKLAELETRPVERAPINMAELLAQVVELAHDHPEADERRLTLTVPQAPWPLPSVLGDRDLLLLAVHNLVDNAIKFSRSGDTLEVRAFEDGAFVVVEVADTGPGIAENDLPHVWEELYRGQSARSVPGSGLGLALVQAIIVRHGGQVTLRSRAGQGTVFTLRLPMK